MQDKDTKERFCSVCGRSEKNVGELISIPGGMDVCKECMDTAMKMAQQFSGFADFFSNGMKDEASKEKSSEEKSSEDKNRSEAENINSNQPDDLIKSDNKSEDFKGDENVKPGSFRMNGGFGLPNVGFINMSDIQSMFFGTPSTNKPKKSDEPVIDITKIPLPHKIKASLDEYVIGQEQAKKVMSVAVYNHYKRVASETVKKDDTLEEFKNVEIEKSNVLLIGPTGCGKTYLVKTLAKLLDVPLAIADATSLTEAGYIGDDIESVVSKLLAAADNDVEKAQTGIVFIDEIDKIAKKKETRSRDVSGESVQQGMLKLLEGAKVEVPVGANSKNAMVPLATVDTRHILFICGGAFPDLDEIIKQRIRKQTSIGFNAELKDTLDKRKDILKEVTVEDIKKFGMIPEFVGRLPIICTMEGLTEDMFVDILKEPKNAIIKQYQKLLSMDEVKLEFEDEALHSIAKKAMERDTGARALRAIIEDIMMDIMFEIPKDDNIGRVIITKDYIEGTGGPVIDLRGGTLGLSERDELKNS